MSENTIITKTKENLERVLTSNGSQELEANLLETLTSKLKYDASLFVNQTTGESSDAVIVTLLPISINVLKLSAITPLQRLGTLVELVGALLASKSLSQVLTFISPEDLLTAVKSSQVPPLQRVAIEQISKATTSEISNTPEFITAIVEQLASKENETTQPIELCLEKIITNLDGDTFKYLLSGKPLEIFNKMWKSNDATLVGRLMEVMKYIVLLKPSKEDSQLEAAKTRALEFFQFPSNTFDPEKWDGLFVATIFQMYRQIFASPYHPPPSVLLDSKVGLSTQLEVLGKLFHKRNDLTYIEVRTLLLSDIVGTFAALSRSKYETIIEFFNYLDKQYQIVESVENTQLNPDEKNERQLLLTMISPSYLLKYYPKTLKSIHFNAGNVSALRNVLSYGPSFEFIDPQQSDFMDGLVDYNDKMFVLSGILQSKEGKTKLLNDWSQVMNMVIDPEFAVTAPEAVELRRNVLEILVDMLPHDLGLWYGGVKEAYRELIFGRPVADGPSVAVAQKTM